MGLYKDLSVIMGQMETLPKTGFNPVFNYSFAQEGDLLKVLRPALAGAGIAVFVSADEVHTDFNVAGRDRNQHLTTVKGSITFVKEQEGDQPEVYTIGFIGMGQDGQDKGAPKAITMGVKYALMKTFLIDTGDDTEHDRIDTAPTPAPARAKVVPPQAARGPQEPAQDAPLPFGGPDPTLPFDEAPRPSGEPTINERQVKLVFGKLGRSGAGLTNSEIKNVVRSVTGQDVVENIPARMLDELLEVGEEYGREKARG